MKIYWQAADLLISWPFQSKLSFFKKIALKLSTFTTGCVRKLSNKKFNNKKTIKSELQISVGVLWLAYVATKASFVTTAKC